MNNPIHNFQYLLKNRTNLSLDALSQIGRFDQAIAVYWGGSLLEGFGNHTSDIDLYIVTQESFDAVGVEIPLYNGHKMISENIGGPTRIDLNQLVFDAIVQAVHDLRSYDPESKNRIRFDPETLELLHRLSFANHIWGATDAIPIPTKQELGAYIVAEMLDKANSYKLDYIGAKKADCSFTACNCSRLRMRCIVDAHLAMHGETNSRFEKWRIKKLGKLGDQTMLRNYLIAEGMLEYPKGGTIEQLTKHIICLADEIEMALL